MSYEPNQSCAILWLLVHVGMMIVKIGIKKNPESKNIKWALVHM